MPLYTFYNELTGQKKDIYMSMSENHEYIDENGYKWNRVWYSPQASFDLKWDANNQNDWLNKTSKKKGNMGDLFDKSAELSQKREKQFGLDERKEKFKKQWSAARKGRKCPDNIFAGGKSKSEEILEV